MDEVRRLVATIGLSDFRYYAYPAVAFAQLQAESSEHTSPPVISADGPETQPYFDAQTEPVRAKAETVMTHAKRTSVPVAARYPMLVEAVETTPTAVPVFEANGIEAGIASEIPRGSVSATVDEIATESEPTPGATGVRYPLLADVVDTVSSSQPAVPSANSPEATRPAPQAASRPTRRRPRSAGRIALGRP